MSQIHEFLAGKRVRTVLTDGQNLIIETTDGHEGVIGWDVDGPKLLKINVKIVLGDLDITSVVTDFGGN
jgi:hypothetical protein